MIALLLFATITAAPVRQDVPTPLQTPVHLVVSGRTSTLGSIVIRNSGDAIPKTFSGNRLKNAAGFDWWLSRHYALQTDYKPDRAKYLLTILELAYPHYAELFGREPAGIDEKRMAVIYGSSKESLKTVLDADRIAWNFGGGGITFEGFNAAFNYPSGTLQYHQRYIMLHECVHLFQDCLYGTTMTTPGWFYEGIADATSHHVWEAARQRLTVNVVDKPTINNWYDAALEEYAKNPFKASDILGEKRGGRGLGFLLVKYFDTDPVRLMRFRVWRDELIRLAKYRTYQQDSARLIEEIFGAAKLDADFDAWIKARRSSFHYVDWGWEQDGDAMMSYGFPQTGPYSQTNLMFLPKEKASYYPLVMDYPLHPQSPLVGKVERGGDQPTVGCLVDFKQDADGGVAGMGLGVQGRSMLTVFIDQRRRLTIDATDLGGEKQTLEFPSAFVQATAKSFQVGLTIKITGEGVEVTARAGDGGSVQIARLALPLRQALIDRLLSRPMAVVSRGGLHWVTPYVDDARQPDPDLDVTAPANRWRTVLEPELYRLTRAAWRLGDQAPASLVALEDQLADAARHGQDGSVRTAYADRLNQVVADIKACHGAPESIQESLAEIRRTP
ncbi:MAG: hypothetical protein ACHQ50_08505 [Fimbriimonadales bacterium]